MLRTGIAIFKRLTLTRKLGANHKLWVARGRQWTFLGKILFIPRRPSSSWADIRTWGVGLCSGVKSECHGERTIWEDLGKEKMAEVAWGKYGIGQIFPEARLCCVVTEDGVVNRQLVTTSLKECS